MAFRAIHRRVATACLTALLGAAAADAQQRSDDALTLQAAIERAFAANPTIAATRLATAINLAALDVAYLIKSGARAVAASARRYSQKGPAAGRSLGGCGVEGRPVGEIASRPQPAATGPVEWTLAAASGHLKSVILVVPPTVARIGLDLCLPPLGGISFAADALPAEAGGHETRDR
jgi:hypothetical protein